MAQAAVSARAAFLTVADQDEPQDLARLAQTLAMKLGHRKPFPGWASQRKWLDVAGTVTAACATAGWPPRQYIRAQVESLRPLIERGIPLCPGHFSGSSADARFERWVDRHRRAHGDPGTDRLVEDRRKRERCLAAAAAFGVSYFTDGLPRSVAEERAREWVPQWSAAGAGVLERLVALEAALSAVESTLPHRVLVPAGRWLWKDARAAFRVIVETPADRVESPVPHDPSLGDFV